MSNPLDPLQQATITISGCDLQAVLLPDGQPAIVFAELCKALEVESSSQARHIRAHPVIAEALASARLETAGGSQVANVLIAWGIPLWLTGIRLASVKPKARPRLIAFQKDVIRALYRHFFSPTTAIPEPAPQLSPWEAVHAALDELERTLAADMRAVMERVAGLEERMAAAEAEGYRPAAPALARLLAATIERLLEHERRLNRLKRGRLPPRSDGGV